MKWSDTSMIYAFKVIVLSVPSVAGLIKSQLPCRKTSCERTGVASDLNKIFKLCSANNITDAQM